jgi:hypothetical protein
VLTVVCLAGLAPFTERFDWYEGMVAPGGLRAAAAGREARVRYAASDEFDKNSFTPADWAALEGAWAALGADAVRAGAAGPDGLIDDDLAFQSVGFRNCADRRARAPRAGRAGPGRPAGPCRLVAA